MRSCSVVYPSRAVPRAPPASRPSHAARVLSWKSLLRREGRKSGNRAEKARPGFHIDIHVHTKLSSDGRSTRDMVASAAASRGMDAIVLTDHNACAIDSPVYCCGVWLLPGCECSTDSGHILGLFTDKKPDFAALFKDGLPSAADAVQSLHECGAVTVLAHPFQRAGDRHEAPVDCIETANARACFRNPAANAQAKAHAMSLGLPEAGGSDAHSAKEVGNAYTVVIAEDCSLPALREAFMSGRCIAVLAKNTPRRFKGYSQFRQAWRSRNPIRIIKGIAYIFYCLLLDVRR